MALVALLVTRDPFFAVRAVPWLVIPMHEKSGQVQLTAQASSRSPSLLGSARPGCGRWRFGGRRRDLAVVVLRGS